MENLLTPATVLVGFVVFLAGFLFFRRPKSLPPGPWFVLPGKQAHLTLTKLADKYGPIYSLRLGHLFTAVVVNDVDTFREAIITKGDHFVDRNIPPLIRTIAPIEGKCYAVSLCNKVVV